MKGSNFSSMTFKIRKIEVVWQSLLFSWKPVITIFEININSIKSLRGNIGKHQLKLSVVYGDRFASMEIDSVCDGCIFALFVYNITPHINSVCAYYVIHWQRSWYTDTI